MGKRKLVDIVQDGPNGEFDPDSICSPRKSRPTENYGGGLAKKGVKQFAGVVDYLAEMSADILTGGATKAIPRNFAMKSVEALFGGNAGQDNDNNSDSLHATDAEDTPDDMFQGMETFGDNDNASGENPGFSPFQSTSRFAGRRGRGIRSRRSATRKQQAEESSEEEDEDDDDGSDAGETPSKSGDDRSNSPCMGNGDTNLRHRGRGATSDNSSPWDTEHDVNAGSYNNGRPLSYGIKGYGRGYASGRGYGTLFLGCTLALCWAVILLAIPLLPILIASWLVSDFIQHGLFGQ